MSDAIGVHLGGKAPIVPTVEAIEDKQRCIDYWGDRAIKAEGARERMREAMQEVLALPPERLDEASLVLQRCLDDPRNARYPATPEAPGFGDHAPAAYLKYLEQSNQQSRASGK